LSFVFVDPAFVESRRDLVRRGAGMWADAAFELRRTAEAAAQSGPWSVTFDPSPSVSRDPHDYYSEGPYWWPDPANPQGPYIRRDGERYPGRFTRHRYALADLSRTVLSLAQAGLLLDEARWLDRAALLLEVWFTAPATRMNPHLEYGQAIPGVCTGRGIGIIELVDIDRIVHALGYLESHAPQTVQAVRCWLADMLRWLITSGKGQDEAANGNNHASWWAVHVAAFGLAVGDRAAARTAFARYRDVLLPQQMRSDGSLPRELERTKSMSYSLFNLNAWTALAEMAHREGEDLWSFALPDGRSLARGIGFVLPFLDNPFEWRGPQIDGIVPADQLCLQMAALRLGMAEAQRVNAKRRVDHRLIRDQGVMGPLALLPGYPPDAG
jgi:hypothetical protein